MKLQSELLNDTTTFISTGIISMKYYNIFFIRIYDSRAEVIYYSLKMAALFVAFFARFLLNFI